MLGRVRLGAGERLVERGDELDADVPRGRDTSSATASASSWCVGEQDRLAVVAVLGLGEEVGGDAGGVGAGVGDRDDLARAGGQVDPDAARDEELRRR